MAFRISDKGGKDDIAVDLAEGGAGVGKGSQHRAVDGGGAVGPGEGVREVPEDSPGVCAGGGDSVAENLIAAELDGRAGDVDEDGGAQGSYDVDAVELIQGLACAVDIGAVKGKDIQGLVGTLRIQLAKYHFTGGVCRQSPPEAAGTGEIALSLQKIDGRTGYQSAVGVAHGVVDNYGIGADDRVAAGVGVDGHIQIPADYEGGVGIFRGKGGDGGANALIAQSGSTAHCHPAFCIGVAQGHIIKYKYIV